MIDFFVIIKKPTALTYFSYQRPILKTLTLFFLSETFLKQNIFFKDSVTKNPNLMEWTTKSRERFIALGYWRKKIWQIFIASPPCWIIFQMYLPNRPIGATSIQKRIWENYIMVTPSLPTILLIFMHWIFIWNF